MAAGDGGGVEQGRVLSGKVVRICFSVFMEHVSVVPETLAMDCGNIGSCEGGHRFKTDACGAFPVATRRKFVCQKILEVLAVLTTRL